MKVYRQEFPNPQFRRENWLNLNGEWEFEIDFCNEGEAKEYYLRDSLNGKINVPFAPESELSGVGYTDFMDAVWYRKEIVIPDAMKGKKIYLHFGAVDYEAKVYVNGKFAGSHRGGYMPFAVDITPFLSEDGGKNAITVHAIDDIRHGRYGGGKQCRRQFSYGCFYTRTTGIWQTVWLEAVEPQHIDFFRLTPMVEQNALAIELNTVLPSAVTVKAEAYFEGKAVGEATAKTACSCVSFNLDLSELHLWVIGKGNLYDLKLTLFEGDKVVDEVYTYFGMRSVKLEDGKFYLNGRSVFGRFVLDQGFYEKGVYTAPDASCFDEDIKLSMELGFNGARFHEKAFEPLALYAADKAGYMVWDEYYDWGVRFDDIKSLADIVPDWLEEVRRDYNHPSIIGWCCLNETWDKQWDGREARQDNDIHRVLYSVVKSLEPMRPVIDTSGNFHVVTDTYDIHCYEQDPEKFAAHYAENPYYDNYAKRQTYNGTPYWVSEYGGIKLMAPGEKGGWGYGTAAEGKEAFIARYKGLTDVLLDNPKCWALCYTQLYDVEQEQNGLYFYDRTDRFTPEEKAQLREIMLRKAAVED